MTDLKEYYLNNVSENEYHYRFRSYILASNKKYNIFFGEEEDEELEFLIIDIEEAIEKFKSLCQPEIQTFSKEQTCWFYLLTFFFHHNGYYIEEFPHVLRRPPNEPTEFTYTEIRNKAFALGLNVNGTIPYRVRRQIVAQLTFKTNGTTLDIGESIEEKFKKISTRNASFQEMALDEKLQEIANLIENMLKENGKFITLDYASVAFEYLSDETIKNYRKQMQCFRHSSEEAVAERRSYTDAQKNFFVDFSIVIVKTIHELKSRL